MWSQQWLCLPTQSPKCRLPRAITRRSSWCSRKQCRRHSPSPRLSVSTSSSCRVGVCRGGSRPGSRVRTRLRCSPQSSTLLTSPLGRVWSECKLAGTPAPTTRKSAIQGSSRAALPKRAKPKLPRTPPSPTAECTRPRSSSDRRVLILWLSF